ncbi:MAG: hypothetical protein LBE12_03215 [Planctomycetaceae bacterium]|nr:hypothetical protein [Planctomycetaceae bacterium]
MIVDIIAYGIFIAIVINPHAALSTIHSPLSTLHYPLSTINYLLYFTTIIFR